MEDTSTQDDPPTDPDATHDLVELDFKLNGVAVRAQTPPDGALVELLREDFGLTGTKVGCGVGACGTCSVLLNGQLVSGCLVPTAMVDGQSVTTIEGLATDQPALYEALTDAFQREGGFQCGICTPGQLLAATALLLETARPTEAEVQAYLAGNLCRCTGYAGIKAAVTSVADGPGAG